jgi:predicted TIM-barrel fold metal-dependent hydrolase
LSDAVGRGWDCHAHLFGPYGTFPLAAERSYTPPEALEAQYLALLARLQLGHGVLVHPSAYGDDHSLLLHALAAQRQWRGVAVLRPGAKLATPAALRALRDQGVRGVRFSQRSGTGANFAGSASFADLLELAPRLAEAGLHAELWTDCKVLPDLAPQIRTLPVPVVIDHMGGFDVRSGIDDAGFACLRRLLAQDEVWVKLCAYRNLLEAPDIEAGRPYHEALLAANPRRLLWGSDWPHLRVQPVSDAAALLALFTRWTANDELVAQVLTLNPAALYA